MGSILRRKRFFLAGCSFSLGVPKFPDFSKNELDVLPLSSKGNTVSNRHSWLKPLVLAGWGHVIPRAQAYRAVYTGAVFPHDEKTREWV